MKNFGIDFCFKREVKNEAIINRVILTKGDEVREHIQNGRHIFIEPIVRRAVELIRGSESPSSFFDNFTLTQVEVNNIADVNLLRDIVRDKIEEVLSKIGENTFEVTISL